MKAAFPAAVLLPLCACSAAGPDAPETVTCRTLPSPDGALELRLEAERGGPLRKETLSLSVCRADGACAEAYEQLGPGWFGATWEGRRGVLIVATSRDARAAPTALDVDTRLMRLRRSELRRMPLLLSAHGPFVTNLWDPCPPVEAEAADHAA